MSRARPVHAAVAFVAAALEQDPSLRVRRLADRAGYSERRLLGLCRDEAGLSPKELSRLCRFDRVLRLVQVREEVDWVSVALEAGYADQAHLIHEFRALAGLTPGEYLRVKTAHLRHVPISDPYNPPGAPRGKVRGER